MMQEKQCRIGLCASSFTGRELVSYICDHRYPVEFCCIVEGDEYANSIETRAAQNNIPVYRVNRRNCNQIVQKALHEHVSDIVFLLWWPFIMKEATITKAKRGFINTHPGLLPFNKGMHPYYWSMVENTPAGVTIHWVTPGIDDGNIICQKELSVSITMMGEDLYFMGRSALIDLFKENIAMLFSGNIRSCPQPTGQGSFHWAKELDIHSCIDLDRLYQAKDLINIMRGRSFTSGPSAFFLMDGKKYYLKLKIVEAL